MKTILRNTVRYWLDTLASDATQARLPEADLQGIVRTVEMAVEWHDPELWSLALELTSAIESHMQRYGTWVEWDSLVQTMIARARDLGDGEAESKLLVQKGAVAMNRHDRATAIRSYRQASRVSKRLGNDQRLATSYSNLGYLYMTLGLFWRSVVLNQRAIEIFTLSGDTRRLAYTVSHLGLTYFLQQRWNEAELHLNRVGELMEQAGDSYGAAMALQNLGLLHERTARLDQSLDYLLQARDRFQQLGNPLNVAKVLMDIGVTYRGQARLDQAERVYIEAEAVFQAIGDVLNLARVRHNLGMVYTQLENWVEAERCFHRALEHWRTEKDDLNLANTLGDLASLYIRWCRPLQARTALTEAGLLLEGREGAGVEEIRGDLNAHWQALGALPHP